MIERAPIRVNASHDGIVGDSPRWRDGGGSACEQAHSTSLGVEIVASLVAGTRAQVDDVSLKSS